MPILSIIIEPGVITSYVDVLLRFSNIKEVFCGIQWIRCRIQRFRNSPAGESQGKYSIGKDCPNWSRRLGWLIVMKEIIWAFPGAIIPRTLVCNTLTEGVNSSLSCPLVKRLENVSLYIAHAILAGESLTVTLKIKGKLPAAKRIDNSQKLTWRLWS